MAPAKILKLIRFSCNSLLLTSYLQSRIIHLANSPTDELSEKNSIIKGHCSNIQA